MQAVLSESAELKMNIPKQQFGGDWTSEKLERVRKYLVAYATIMNKQHYGFAYIDAFAGTGYNTPKKTDDDFAAFFEGATSSDTQEFIDGSARIALKVKPAFDQYIFIERDPKRFLELGKLKTEFPDYAEQIRLVNSDANTYLSELCGKFNWSKRRAVLFLDPFGMQVTWETISAIAKTQAIDLWLLFPLGIGVNRLLRRDGQIPESWRNRLNTMFGSTDWYDAFYQKVEQPSLFSDQPEVETRKQADYALISAYFIKRLKSIFPHVAENPLPLFNSSNCPLYLLCFAAGNPGSGGKTGVKIAQDILKA